MKLLIAGSRSITNEAVTIKYVHEAIAFNNWLPTEIVSGMAKEGPDAHAIVFATVRSLPLTKFYADWNKYGNSAGMIRNAEMADYADAAVVIWDGSSAGALNMIEQMQKRNKVCHVVIYREPKLDGITHINIYSKAKTQLGRMLSNFANTPFTHPVYGAFASIEGYWYWLSTGKTHDNLKNLCGLEAKHTGRKYKRVHYAEFESDVIEGLKCKLHQHPEIMKMFLESHLPFSHYYYYGEETNPIVVENNKVTWIVNWFENYRRELRDKAS